MEKNRPKDDHMKARAGWLKLQPKNDSELYGKKRFIIHKNINSALFQSVIKHEPVVEYRKKSLPQVSKTTKAMHIVKVKKEASVQVENDRIQSLENELREKNNRLHVLENLFTSANTRKKPKLHNSIHASKHGSVCEEPIIPSKVSSKTSFLRHSSLPSLKSLNFLEYCKHPAFLQPKFTKNHPKIILSNPITGLPPPF